MYPVCLQCYEVFDPRIWDWDEDLHLCPRMKCNHAEIFMCDELMIPIVFVLNKKGYTTENCCSGHNWYRKENYWYSDAYVSFDTNVKIPYGPDGFDCRMSSFEITDGSGNVVLDSDAKPTYKTSLCVRPMWNSRGELPENPTQYDIQKYICDINQIILKWAESLPLSEIKQQEHLVDIHSRKLDDLYKEQRNEN